MATNTKKAAKKSVGKMPPTLLVGLGGTGCDIVGRVYKLANEEQRKYIQFVFLDTDANELRERKAEAPFAHTVQTSRKITVGQALRNDPEAYEHTFPINPQLMNKPLTEGAGQIRAVSKLAFDMCVREGRLTGLHEAINNLQKLKSDDMEQSIRVLIVSTLVGGTGSGILLPVSLYIRNYLENECHKKPIIRGFCMMPDIFFNDTGKTEIEKKNLRTNAYATLRELDAFILKADSKQDSEIRSRFTLKMPKPGTIDQYDDYDLNPLDYCFLFDAQNTDGATLDKLEEYKQHAADCIYASSVSRLHKRLNSSEDNTILERCKENGRNRYCGTGTSKLIYPFNAVRDYMALNWMSQAMTDDWLRYDKKIENEKIRRQQSRTRGVRMPALNEREAYVDYIESDVGQNNSFAQAIFDECHDLHEDLTETARWQSYYKELSDYVGNYSKVSLDVEGLENTMSIISGKLDGNDPSDLSEAKNIFISLIQQMTTSFGKAKKQAEAKAMFVADGMFAIDNFDIKSKHRIEHWLLNNKEVPIHPNSVRYFLYNLEQLLSRELDALNAPADPSKMQADDADVMGEGTQSFEDVRAVVEKFFDEPRYSDMRLRTYVNTLAVPSNFLDGKKKNEFKDTINGLISDCDDYLTNVKTYFELYIKVAVIKQALNFVDNLSSNYEAFFNMLSGEIKNISGKIDKIKETYENRSGSPIMYVCASPNCLDLALKDCPNTVDPIALTDDFRETMFNTIFKNSGIDSEQAQKQQTSLVKKLVSEGILDFWRETVIDQYGNKVDMDIIEALLKEAEYEEGYFSFDEKKRYVDQKYREALHLAAPFIEKPKGQEPYEIIACGMSTEIEDKNDIAKSEILRLFGNFERDALMDKYQVLFMKALYNLKVSDLHKFAPRDGHAADPIKAGSYYDDYVERIDNVLPDSEKSNTITPHLDRRWHFVGVMPDLDDANEIKNINEAQKAFFIAFAFHYVEFCRDQYKFVDANGDYISDKIIVNDGKCDKLHEVYDAMSISRPLVRDFLARFKETVKAEKSLGIGNRDFTCSGLYRAIDKMHFNKYNVIPTVSILEIPLLFKASVGSNAFNDDDAVTMLHNFIDILEEYLCEFYDDVHVRYDYLVKWLDEQASLMFDNIENYYDNGEDVILQNPFSDVLLSRLANNIIGKFRNLSAYSDDADAIAEKYQQRWSSLRKI